MRVLFLEDEEAIRGFVRINLKRNGMEVTEAEDGETALALAKSAAPPFDIALLDVMLPTISGFDVCEQLRQLFPRMGIIMLTAKSQEEDKIRGLELGADDYVQKPFSPGELIARLNALKRRMLPYGEEQQGVDGSAGTDEPHAGTVADDSGPAASVAAVAGGGGNPVPPAAAANGVAGDEASSAATGALAHDGCQPHGRLDAGQAAAGGGQAEAAGRYGSAEAYSGVTAAPPQIGEPAPPADQAQPASEQAGTGAYRRPLRPGDIASGPFLLSAAERRLWKDNVEIVLTPTEWTLVKLLMEREGEGLSRDDILNAVWGRHYVGDLKIVDVNIRRIRQKIEIKPSDPKHIETLWGYGYRWNRSGGQ